MSSYLPQLSEAELCQLVAKHSASGPRYTSYPTAVEFSESYNLDGWREELPAALGGSGSIYIHLPFCHSLCYFCACHKVISEDKSVLPPYLEAVFQEIDFYRNLLADSAPSIEQIHWGGGSPNYLSPSQLTALHQRTVEAFPNLLPDCDVSIELDPRTTTDEQLEALRQSGFNRVSLGVQDFDSAVQEAVNRIQPYEMTKSLCDKARAGGFAGLNIDLIYGLPLQTFEGFHDTLQKVLEIRPDRIALYGYAHVTWLHKVQRSFHKHHLPSPDERIRIFVLALRTLTEAGYEYIGLDHFALPEDDLALAQRNGKLNRNFMGYTTHKGASILGLGASAISSIQTAYAQNEKDVVKYQQRVVQSGGAIVRGISRSVDDQIRGDVIERILCNGVVNFAQFESDWGQEFESYFSELDAELDSLVVDGLVIRNADELRLTATGKLFARNVAMVFDAYLDRHRKGERPVFSQTV